MENHSSCLFVGGLRPPPISPGVRSVIVMAIGPRVLVHGHIGKVSRSVYIKGQGVTRHESDMTVYLLLIVSDILFEESSNQPVCEGS